MKFGIAFITLIFLSACNQNAKNDQKNSYDANLNSNIMGGQRVYSGDNLSKYAVGIARVGNNRFGTCTGTFVAEDIILTAAHCFIDQSLNNGYEYYAVLSAEFNYNFIDNQLTYFKTELIDIVSITYHTDIANNDIILARIAKAKPGSYKILKLQEKSITDPGEFTAVGYGAQGHTLGQSHSSEDSILRSVKIKYESVDKLKKSFEYSQKNGKGICVGDSGGPDIIFKNGVPTVIGINQKVNYDPEIAKNDSSYNVCADSVESASVPYYYDWIVENVNKMTRYSEIK